MTKSFDEWMEKECSVIQSSYGEEYTAAQEAWNFKQAEVDELKREMLNKANEAYADGQKSMRKMIKSNEGELRKRIDKVIEYLDSCDSCCDISKLHLIKVLQGDSHES